MGEPPLSAPVAAEAPGTLEALRIHIFADGADLPGLVALAKNPRIQGFTTNPTLMRRAGITDYLAFARDVLAAIPDRPISFEVFADEWDEMERQAHRLAALGAQVFVKIPVTNTRGESALPLVERLAAAGLRLNVTAMTSDAQVRHVAPALARSPAAFVSIFAGRVADTGRDPVPMMARAVRDLADLPHVRLIWASPRELLNIFQADAIGCHVITVTFDILGKLGLVGKDLDAYSLETVRMFYEDGRAAGYRL